MRVLFLALTFTLMVAYASAACSADSDCTGSCANGYPEECNNNHCHCDNIHCTMKSDCPIGHNTGCAAHCETSCVNNACQCSCAHG